MTQQTRFYRERQGYIKTSFLILLALASLFFSRPLDILGAPETINFLHFVTIPLACALALLNSRAQDKSQITATWTLIYGILTLLAAMLMSALVNRASIVNVILDFSLVAEPFLMLLAIISIPLSGSSLKTTRNALISFAFFNLVISFIQYVVNKGNPDLVQGVFFSLAGGSIAAIVSLMFGIDYFSTEKQVPIGIRVAVLAAAICQLFISDAKLVLGSFIIGFALLSVTRLSYQTIFYLIASIFLITGFIWGLSNLEIFQSYALWIKPEYFSTLDNDFTRAKTAGLKIIFSLFTSPLNWLFGLGPGHTIGRLGGWMMDKYWTILEPLGATRPYPNLVKDITILAIAENRAVLGTAMFNPLFSWAGIIGDLGFIGLTAYLFIWSIIWRHLCIKDFQRLLILVTFAVAFFPGYLEEPGSMIFTTFLIGLKWHEYREEQRIASGEIPVD